MFPFPDFCNARHIRILHCVQQKVVSGHARNSSLHVSLLIYQVVFRGLVVIAMSFR